MAIYTYSQGSDETCRNFEQETIEAVVEKDKTKQLTLRMPDHLHKAFKLTAVKQGRSMGAVTIELIEKYVKKASDLL